MGKPWAQCAEIEASANRQLTGEKKAAKATDSGSRADAGGRGGGTVLNADGGADADLADVLSGAPGKTNHAEEPHNAAGKKQYLIGWLSSANMPLNCMGA